MSFKFIMTIEGTKQGNFKATAPNKGKSGHTEGMEVHGFSFGVKAPLDTSTGSGGGRQTHSPVQIAKDTSSSSPLLLQAAVTSEIFRQTGVLPGVGGTPGTGGTGSNTGKHPNPRPPIVITKEVDAASPLIYQALVTNENLKTVQISFSSGGQGKEVVGHTIALSNATITNVRRFINSGSHQPSEEIEFTYENLAYTYQPPK